MKITIPTNIDKFYRQLLGLLDRFDPIKGLRNRELDVLAQIMKYNYIYKDLPEEIRTTVVFSKKVRDEIEKTLEINEDVLNNNLSILRKNNILSKDNQLIKFLNIYPGDTFDFIISFKIKKDEK